MSVESPMSVEQSVPRRPLWLIPLVMLVIAILACDDVYVPPPMVGRVEVDANEQGKVYITVENVNAAYNNGSVSDGEIIAYESSDAGGTWHASEHKFAATQANAFPMTMYGETLSFNNTNWNFPRSIFRGIFYDGSGLPSVPRFQLPDGFVANAAQGDQVYIAIGTEGVLVAKITPSGFAPDWKLSTTGITALNPLPLTITQPSAILGIIVLILCAPPFALIHAFLLHHVWLYLLPPAASRALSLKVTAGLVLLAIIGIIYWLTNDRTDLYEVLAVLTATTVLIGLTITMLLAQQAQVTTATRLRLGLAVIVASLIVPGGVAAIFALWWFVFGVVFSYWAYQRVYRRYVEDPDPSPEGRLRRWHVDRLALEMVIMCVVGAVAIALQISFGQALLFRFGGLTSLMTLLGFGLAVAGLSFAIRHYSRSRARYMLEINPDVPPKREWSALSGDLWRHSVMWFGLAVILTIATFFGQMMAYGWFTSLLETPAVR